MIKDLKYRHFVYFEHRKATKRLFIIQSELTAIIVLVLRGYLVTFNLFREYFPSYPSSHLHGPPLIEGQRTAAGQLNAKYWSQVFIHMPSP